MTNYELRMVDGKSILTLVFSLLVSWVAVAAVPTQAEFTAAGNVIADLLEPQMAAMKSGKKKPAEVADYAMSLVGESETAAAKFLLARRAYGLYMKGGAYDKAAEAIGEMRAAVPDMPNERMLKAVQPDARNVSEKKAPAVHAIVADLKAKVFSQNEIAKLEAALKKAKVSEREVIHRQLGERHAVMGDWKSALEHFAKSGGDVATMAAAESGGKADANKLAGFWWDYSESPTVKKSVATAVRQHAVAIYQKGLDDGTISGLNKKLAEQRVVEAQKSDNNAVTSSLPVVSARENKEISGLAIHFGFDGKLKEDVGKATWEPSKKVKWCADHRGRASKAIVLDGATTLVNNKSFSEIENQMTIVAWVKPEGRIDRFVGQSGGGLDGMHVSGPTLITAINHYEDFRRADQGILVGENGIVIVEHGAYHIPARLVYEKELGKDWLCIAIVIETDKTPLLYLNGKEVATGEKSNRIPMLRFGKAPKQVSAEGTKTVFGGDIYGMKPFVGAIADLAVYNRALTAEEIMRLYKN